jgi:hypothetical protein
MRSLKGVHLAATFLFSAAILFLGKSGGKVSSQPVPSGWARAHARHSSGGCY